MLLCCVLCCVVSVCCPAGFIETDAETGCITPLMKSVRADCTLRAALRGDAEIGRDLADSLCARLCVRVCVCVSF